MQSFLGKVQYDGSYVILGFWEGQGSDFFLVQRIWGVIEYFLQNIFQGDVDLVLFELVQG